MKLEFANKEGLKMKPFTVKAYNTAYVIENYDIGDIPKLESDLSIWDDVYHRRVPKYFYDESNRHLYIPRGYNMVKLGSLTDTKISVMKESNDKTKVVFQLYSPPRNDIQKESVRFFTGMEEYSKMKGESQQILSLPPGAGKTYCAIAACSVLGYKSIVIVGTDDLRKQWTSKIMEYTKLPKSSVCVIVGGKAAQQLMHSPERKLRNHIFYIATHSTLREYMKSNGFYSLNELFLHLGIGIKIIDEAHLQYANTMIIDYACNVWKNFYLTATFEQSAVPEDVMFQRAFQMVYRLKITSTDRKHVLWMRAIFSSKANAVEKLSVRGPKGFDKHKYIDYEMSKGVLKEVFIKLMNWLAKSQRIEGKILVLSSKKESCETFMKIVDELEFGYKTCVHYTGSKVDDLNAYDVICATPLMLGTALDISGLRVVINTEPMRSKRNTIQLVGRLREYAPDKDTYYIEPIDKSLPGITSMLKDREDVLKNIVKDIIDVDILA